MITDPYRLVESHTCPMSTCQAPAGSPCRTTAGKVALKYHTARFQLVPALRSELHVATPAVRHPGSAWQALPAQKESVGVHRLSGPAPGEQPARVAVCRGVHVVPVGDPAEQEIGDRSGDRGRWFAET